MIDLHRYLPLPLESAAKIALTTVQAGSMDLIRFVLFDDNAYRVFTQTAESGR